MFERSGGGGCRIQRGDVVTYCYRKEPHCIVKAGRVLAEVREARRRGIFFDVGHGAASFDFSVAQNALADGFPPDTLSTDMQVRHIEQTPRHHLPLVMSKLKAAGMAEADIFAGVTRNPANILKKGAGGRGGNLGTLAVGAEADVSILAWHDRPTNLVDTSDATRRGGLWKPVLTLRGGQIIK